MANQLHELRRIIVDSTDQQIAQRLGDLMIPILQRFGDEGAAIEIGELRVVIGQLSNKQILERLGDLTTLIFQRFGVAGTLSRQKLIRNAAIWLAVFMIYAVIVFRTFGDEGSFGSKVVNGTYFGMVTLTTTGYGDIVPKTALQKVLTSVLILLGGCVIIQMNKATGKLLAWACLCYPKRMLFLATGTIMVLIALGAGGALLTDDNTLGTYPNSLYFAITTVTGVGYGDIALKGTVGRIYVTLWLTASSMVFPPAFRFVCENLAHYLNQLWWTVLYPGIVGLCAWVKDGLKDTVPRMCGWMKNALNKLGAIIRSEEGGRNEPAGA